ncbi:MAG: hypothetical protein QOE33_1885 [Acidobacteriota bacterium]|nr:hypothetical protein [Acidobacteriota bacterium]
MPSQSLSICGLKLRPCAAVLTLFIGLLLTTTVFLPVPANAKLKNRAQDTSKSTSKVASAPASRGKFKAAGAKVATAPRGVVRPLVLGCGNATPTISFGQTVNGTLANGDCVSPIDGSFYDAYSFTGAAGQQVTIDMTSTAFDPYLYLMRPGETTISADPNTTIQDDDGGGGTNARISLTLQTSGTYTILANSYGTGITPVGTGAYTLTLTGSGTGTTTLRIDTVTPRAGRASGGQQVKLVGAFDNLSSVVFGGVAVSWSYTNGTSEIAFNTPAHAVGAVGIDLANTSGGALSKSNAFAYLPTTFTDDTLTVGVTTAKAQHIIELRQAVDALRAVAGLAPAAWTDATLAPTVTIIKAVHITELRAYLDEAATQLGYPTSPYTDPSLGAGFTIKRVHIEELRQRIRSIAG